MQTLTNREIRLEVVHNARHIGGYQTAGGTLTRDDLVRSATLRNLTPAGIEALAGTGITTVIDLRSAKELEEDPTPDLSVAGITMLHLPVFDQDASPVGLSATDFNGFGSVYPRMLEDGARAYRAMLQTVSEAPGRVLFHCSAGKDRTGAITAVLLEFAGVSDEDIIADYSVSERLLAPQWESSDFEKRIAERGFSMEKVKRLLASSPDDMQEALGHIRQRWGGAEGYLEFLGLSPETRTAVRARLIH